MFPVEVCDKVRQEFAEDTGENSGANIVHSFAPQTSLDMFAQRTFDTSNFDSIYFVEISLLTATAPAKLNNKKNSQNER